MRHKGILQISYKENGSPLVMIIGAPLGMDECAVLLHVLQGYEGRRIGVDVDWTATDVERLRPQVAALGITEVEWKYMYGSVRTRQ